MCSTPYVDESWLGSNLTKQPAGTLPDTPSAVHKRAPDAGVARIVFGVPPEAKDKVLPMLDASAKARGAAA
jgi:hypothetical protein